MKNATKLTRNQTLVMDTLGDADAPMTAYSLLDRLRDKGLRAPPQIYRALDKLLDLGLVHRLESLNAFVACRQPDCHDHGLCAFAICEDCGVVAEFEDATIERRLAGWANTNGFRREQTTIEIRGRCKDCAA